MQRSRTFAGIFLLLSVASCRQNETQPPIVESVDEKGDKLTAPSESKSLSIFEQRILPILASPRPSSCTECHLSGVELKHYVQADQRETFASLVEAGLINVEAPLDSKILTFIQRSPEQPSLISQEVRELEYDAFRDWIVAAVDDPVLLEAESDQPAGPALPLEVVRHARNDRVLSSFVDNIWSEVGRCAACHSPDRNQKQVEEHGSHVSWIRLNNPEATMRYMIDQELIDPTAPEKSLLLRKPTMEVEHGGGQKMVVGDRTYKQFRRFIDDYAAIMAGKYTKIEQIPKPGNEVSQVTEIWLKIEGVPRKFDKMLLQVDLYQQREAGWSDFRVATSDRPVFGEGNLWQHSLSLTAPRGSTSAPSIPAQKLPAGRYLAKLYVDQRGKLRKDFKAELGDEEFVGQVEFESGWPVGYGRMTVIQYPGQ